MKWSVFEGEKDKLVHVSDVATIQETRDLLNKLICQSKIPLDRYRIQRIVNSKTKNVFSRQFLKEGSYSDGVWIDTGYLYVISRKDSTPVEKAIVTSRTEREYMISLNFEKSEKYVYHVLVGEDYEGERLEFTFVTKEDAIRYVEANIAEFCEKRGEKYRYDRREDERIEWVRQTLRDGKWKDSGTRYIVSRDRVWKSTE
jgi:hypothetical protein